MSSDPVKRSSGWDFHSSVWPLVKVVPGSGTLSPRLSPGVAVLWARHCLHPSPVAEELLASPASFLAYFLTLGWNIFSSFLTKHGSQAIAFLRNCLSEILFISFLHLTNTLAGHRILDRKQFSFRILKD